MASRAKKGGTFLRETDTPQLVTVSSSVRRLFALLFVVTYCCLWSGHYHPRPLNFYTEQNTPVTYEKRRESVNRLLQCVNNTTSYTETERGFLKVIAFLDNKEDYDIARASWNQRIQQYPNAVIFPTSATQVSVAVQCARKSGHHVCSRNGKHSFEGDSCFHGIVVDVSGLDMFAPLRHGDSIDKGSFQMGAGLRLGQVTLKLAAHDRILPMGSCASVELTGLMLVGGFGYLMRPFGLTADYLTAVELVDYRGNIILANATNEYADYLWLARGGGAGVFHFPGIITSLFVSELPMVESGSSEKPVHTTFRIEFKNATSQNAVRPFHKPSLSLACFFYGNDTMHDAFLESGIHTKLKNLIPGGHMTEILRLDDLALKRSFSGLANNTELASGHHGYNLVESKPWHMNRWKGYSAMANDLVSSEAFQVLAETIYESIPLSCRFADLRALGGAVKRISPDETAFGHRNAFFVAATSHFYYSDDNQTYVRKMLKKSHTRQDDFVESLGSSFGGQYAGYIHHGDSIEEDMVSYFGGNAARIREIKQRRDPDNFFALSSNSELEYS